MDEPSSLPAGRCDACGQEDGPLMKLSLGTDFFGRAYDRLSPSSDQRPKWYCEPCSMQKNLQRDVRDIKAEFEKLSAGQASDMTQANQLQRAQARLQEIIAILDGQTPNAQLLNLADVNTLLQRMQAQAGSPSITR
jgi:hypothetical protein